MAQESLSAFDRATGKLSKPGVTGEDPYGDLADLPPVDATGMWDAIKKEYGLRLPEVGALQVHRKKLDQRQQNDPPRDQPEPMLRFRSLLASKGITPIQPVMMQLVKNFASSVAIVSDAEIAAALYYSASRIPRSATEIILKEQGIAVAQPFQASDPSKAILLHAFRDGYPMILKVSSAASIKHEADVISDMMNIDGCDLSEKHL
eukprot:CAMPEP_0119011066 /NCGR_PEP_ID=MMETSP1176-20130426/5432_1 /TAXON_ID=265551 /ORGANISM="Synedropsis recta cf, Strain CCMP1620" /LENGTH=204 /DNA_ID=CAMNT_0006963829 /DNA_START=68 /DNA_END=678 /DNA_ORIENTATION=-